MAEMLLSSFLQALMQTIGNLLVEEYRAEQGLKSQLKKLEACVRRMISALADLERRQNRSAVMETVLCQLREVAYEANDLLDEFATEKMRRESLRTLKWVRNSFSSVNPKRAFFRSQLAGRIKDVDDRVAAIARDNGLSTGNIDQTRQPFAHMGQSSIGGTIAAAIPNTCAVYGREEQTVCIVKWVTTNENSFSVPSVVAIQAMGGIGKSTLAREVYDRVSGYFSMQMWVHVSRNSNVDELMRLMVVEIEKEAALPQINMWALYQLQERLKNHLHGHKYLIVLDGMWSENSEEWECLKATLTVGATGSRIIVTTRSERVAKLVCPDHKISLKGLSHDHCWSIFAENAFEDETECRRHHELKEIGYKIAEKCNGSPHVAKILGSQLSMNRERREWLKVLQSDFSGKALEPLKNGYDLLPAHLKDCFRFCSIFPSGFQIQRDELILLWMANNLIRKQEQPPKRIEDVGRECIDSLLQKSFFERSRSDPNTYVMNDLLHDLSQSVSLGECGIIEHAKAKEFSGKIRHLSIFCNSPSSSSHRASTSSSPCLETAYNHKQLHSLIFLASTKQCFSRPPESLHKYYKNLHALDLSNSNISELKQDISNLKFLRYLNLSNTKIESLPNSLNDLLNLQSMLLRNCYKLKTLPQSVRKMINLRHLDLHLDTDFAGMENGVSQDVNAAVGVVCITLPEDLGRLTQLQTLSRFVLKKKMKHGMRHLENLNELQGDLLIANLEVITEPEAAASANLYKKTYIERLKLQWTEENCSAPEGAVEDILEQLKPTSQLQELWLEGYSGIYMPTWVDARHLGKLRHLVLSNCKRYKWIPALGQLQFLKELHIRGLHSIENLGCDFCSKDGTSFPSLRKVVIEDMPILKGWSGEKNCKIPFLRELVIRNCPEFILLTHNFPLLHTMTIEGCPSFQFFNGLPALQFLDVIASGGWIWNEEWPFFDSLVSLKVSGFPETLLPTKLEYLSIRSCSQLQKLPEGLHDLKDLEEMEIQDCKQLISLPSEVVFLSRLEYLKISDCPMMSFLPTDGLPRRLQVFSVKNCPLIEQYCHRERQKFEQIPLIISSAKNTQRRKPYTTTTTTISTTRH